MNTIVEVLVELDNGKSEEVTAKIKLVKETTYIVKYLSPTNKLHGDQPIYKYEKEEYERDKGCVSGFYYSKDEDDAGFVRIEGGWVLKDGDSDDYEPSDEPDESETDESVTESEED
jgi:hypothetical protein